MNTGGKYEIVDEETGEIEDGPDDTMPFEGRVEEPEPEPQPARYATESTEIIPPGHDRAADGAMMLVEAKTAGNFLDMMEDGRFSRDVSAHMRGLARQMAHYNETTGNKAKGKLTIVIDLEKEGSHFDARAKFTVKAPELPRPKTVVWADPAGGNFTRFPPGQAQMFGLRPARNVP